MSSDLASVTFEALNARTILDSRGNPTVEARARLEDGTVLIAAAPAGASTGRHEAVELRDHGRAFSGRGVRGAVFGINQEIANLVLGRKWWTLNEIDQALADLDGTSGYSRLGANAVVAVSTLATRAFAHTSGISMHQWIAHQSGSTPRLPVPHFNVLNGGAHAPNALDFQEFMIAPIGATSEEEAVQIGSEVYHCLASLVRQRYGSTGLGDEGGFAPQVEDPRAALELILEAISGAGYSPGLNDVAIALDPAANGFYLGDGKYRINGMELARQQVVDYYLDLIDTYPIWSLEDGFAEDDHEGWIAMAQAAQRKVQLVGDDLYVTDPARIRAGAENGYSNATLIKPNQIGTISETLEAIAAASEVGMACMISHRSGETSDTFIADLAVGTGVGQIKAGAPARGERVAKYNRLTEIEYDHSELPYGLAPMA